MASTPSLDSPDVLGDTAQWIEEARAADDMVGYIQEFSTDLNVAALNATLKFVEECDYCSVNEVRKIANQLTTGTSVLQAEADSYDLYED